MSEPRLVWRWAVRVWRGSPGLLAWILLLSVASAALLAWLPWLWQYVIDQVRTRPDPVRLRELALWMAAVGVGHAGVYLALQCLRAVMNCRIEWQARKVVFDHLTDLDPSFYRRWRTGDLVTRLYDDAGEKIAWFLCSGVFRAVEALLVLIACLGAMIAMDPMLTLWVVSPLPLLLVGQALLQHAQGRQYRAVQDAISAINDELSTTFGGIRIVQAAGLQAAARRRFVAVGAQQRDAEVVAALSQTGIHLMYGYGWQLAVAVLLLFGGGRVIDGALTLGEYVAFEGFVMSLVWPMFDLGTFVSRYKQAGVALGRLQEIVDAPLRHRPSPRTPSGNAVQVDGAGTVSEDGATLLAGISLTLAPGETLAVVGEVGSGKSVLIQLLAGSRAGTGECRIGGVPVSTLNDAARARTLAWVPQDPVLLSATLEENILLGRDLAPEDVEHALRVSRLAQDLPAFPHGLATRVGERGVTLSGGQQQRVALARALAGKPSVLLLDDATAALDADTEAAFWSALRRELPHVTAVVVTHRVATLQQADRIVVLDRGTVAQAGIHAELVTQDGPYQRMYGRYRAQQAVAEPVAS